MYIFKYWNGFYKYLGWWMVLILVIAPVIGIIDSLGITLFIPILANILNGGEGEPSNLEQRITEVFEFLNIPYSNSIIVIGLVCLFLGKSILKFFNLLILAYAQSKFWVVMRKEAIQKLGLVDFVFYLKTNTGSILNSMVGEMNKYVTGVKGFLDSINAGFLIMGYGIMLMMVSIKATILLFVLGIGLNYIFVFLNRYGKVLSRKLTFTNKEFMRNMIETVNFFKYFKATNTYRYKSSILNNIMDVFYVQRRNISIANGLPKVIQEPIVLVIIGVLFWMNSIFLHESTEVILVVLGIAYRANGALSQFQSKRQLFFASLGSLENVKQFMGELEEHEEVLPEADAIPFEEKIQLQNLFFAYQEGTDIIKNLNVEIPKNKTIAFVGPSGAGKSTLVDILTGIQKPHSGKIIVDGKEYLNLGSKAWRSKVGYVTQENIVFDGNVFSNITLSQDEIQIDEPFKNALEWSNSSEFIESMSEGYSTQLGERGVRLSGGQRQRISIARELFKQPNLLILDEATSALDSASEQLIQKSIDALKGKTTVVMIAHRLSTVKNADCIYVLKEGEVVETGTYNELTAIKDGLFKEMVEKQRL